MIAAVTGSMLAEVASGGRLAASFLFSSKDMAEAPVRDPCGGDFVRIEAILIIRTRADLSPIARPHRQFVKPLRHAPGSSKQS
jgi:hypothetical protein